jgi:hypothetical protein
MTDDVTDWTQLREFKGVDITRSYVLSWNRESETLLIDLDLYLCPDHAFYEKPRPAEKACFRPALLEFPYVSEIRADGAAADPAKDLQHGAIDGLRRVGDGRYEIFGEFGQVEVDADRPLLRLKVPIG